MKPLDIAIDYVGGVTKLAEAIGVGQSVVSNWKKRNSVIEAGLCTKIEIVTNGRVTRKDLRPNDWQTIWLELADAPAPKKPRRKEVARA
jgi:DNA-binding transcriptional regulator YdaS (Cro superfamily)